VDCRREKNCSKVITLLEFIYTSRAS